MRRILILVVLAVGGIVAATAMTLGALALAGGDLGDVVHPRLDQQGSGQTQTPSVATSSSPSGQDETPGATPTVDDHGGASEPGDDHGGGDNSGPGGSGSGSDGSGSGSNSGSGGGHSGDD